MNLPDKTAQRANGSEPSIFKPFHKDVPPWVRHLVSAAGLLVAATFAYSELSHTVQQNKQLVARNYQDLTALRTDVEKRLQEIEKNQSIMAERFTGESRAQQIYRESTARDLDRILAKLENSPKGDPPKVTTP